MRFFWQKPLARKAQFQDVLRRLVLSQEGRLDSIVSPDTCMASPTVHAVITAVSRRLAVTPIHVFRKTEKNGKDMKERLPMHPVARLLSRPNGWQSNYDYWQDATSTFLRWGNFYSYLSLNSAGLPSELLPLHPSKVNPEQDRKTWEVTYRVGDTQGGQHVYRKNQVFHARGPARNFLTGDSPINDCKTAIALEILAERFGANFFKNGALPLLIFGYSEGSAGFETEEQENAFIQDLKDSFGGDKMLNTMLLPKGIDKPTSANIKHDEAQFLETRKYQRTVIAGAFGVPPHLVGDLERATFNNVEQQDQDFTQNVVMPVAKAFESAMERDLLSVNARNEGIVIRFNLDSILRAAFKDRQEGLQIQRSNGIISADEWREIEGRNPRDDEFGEDYLHPGNMVVDGAEINDAPTVNGTITDQGAE